MTIINHIQGLPETCFIAQLVLVAPHTFETTVMIIYTDNFFAKSYVTEEIVAFPLRLVYLKINP